MTKPILAGIIPGLLIVGVMVAHANALPNNKTDPTEQAKAWAQIDSQPMSADSAVYLQGNAITVYQDEISRITERYKASGVEDGEQLAVQYVLRREALYHAGQEKGYTASEEEVQNIIDTELEWEKGADGQEYFQTYLDELGMTAEEYWDSQRPLLAKEIVIGKYLDAEKEQSGITDETEWQTYEKKLVQTLIEQDGITYTIQ